jgi:3-deoxy-D-manno-octulosonic-acid transferase
MSSVRLFYTLLLYLLSPIVLLRLLWRARRQRGYLYHVAERFGYYTQTAGEPVIWVHAVSVGETRAAEPLIRALREKYPEYRVLLTHMTPTGRETGESLFGGDATIGYLPYDYPGAVARFLDHFHPRIGVLMETEIWPNLIQGCRARNLPLFLVNARLSEKSFAGYRYFSRLARESVAGLTAIAAQSEDDARRLRELGAREVRVTGSIKFDVAPPTSQLDMGIAWRREFGAARPVLLAASTREGEEALLLDAIAKLDLQGLLLVVVPRHPQRFDEVARLLDARGVRYQRRSAGTMVAAETRILLGDSMGEMFAYYAACDVVFVGGSLLPFGSQNLIEPCAIGKPVLIGPSTYNFAEAAELAVQAGAAIQVPDAATLAREAARLLQDRAVASRIAQAALTFAGSHRGATSRVMEILKP